MKPIYFAPLEGIGNHIYRGVFTRHYKGVDRFYTPFIDINSDGGMKNRNRADILPENNQDICLIPQVLTKNADALGEASKKIADLGYREINLNMGCPSGTVTKKGKGAGMLADTDALARFLDRAFTLSQTKLSVKMRIGLYDVSEAAGLLEVLNRYPLAELIVHPRLMTQFYEGPIHEDVFRQIYETAKMPLCLNPGVRTPEDFARLEAAYPDLTGIMIGRGLVSNPQLAEEIAEKGRCFPRHPETIQQIVPEMQCKESKLSGEEAFLPGKAPTSADDRLLRFRAFHDDLLEAYKEVLFGETPVLFKMKELWVFWAQSIPVEEKLKRKIAKAASLAEYGALVRQIRSLQ